MSRNLDNILGVTRKPAASQPVMRSSVGQEDDDYVPVGLTGMVAAGKKLLAVNRGLIPEDDRDSYENKTFLTTDKLMRERIRLDSGKLRLSTLRRAAMSGSLKHLTPGHFDDWTRGLIVGNQLSSPLEEINPMHLVEQARRITFMGPGGIGSDDAVTAKAQAVHASQFGFVSAIEGPECYDDQSEVYTKRGWTPWREVVDDDEFACRVGGRFEWHKAERIVRAPYKGTMLCVESDTLRLAVTPNHRMLWRREAYADNPETISFASELYGKNVHFPTRHMPKADDGSFTHFQLPHLEKTNHNQREFAPFAIKDWCAFMGWWLSEGNSYVWHRSANQACHIVGVSQSRAANPSEYSEIQDLLRRMGIIEASEGDGKNFKFSQKQLGSYFTQTWKSGCYDKWIPEELFSAPLEARLALLDALLKGDGRYNKKRWCYCTVSERLAASVERLAIELGYTAFTRIEQDKRPSVKTTNFVVSIHREHNRTAKSAAHGHKNGKTYGNYWSLKDYDGIVYCATVPGGLLHVRGKKTTSGIWCGNSGRAGVDNRLALGVHYGSDGNLYQQMRNAKTGKIEWVSHVQASNSRIKVPD